MDPLLVLTQPRVGVDPGGEVRVQVTVRNPGELVEQYRFHVLGEAAAWTQVVPRDVSVMPGRTQEQTVQVVFRPPPAPAAPAGEVPFGVRCVSLEHTDDAAVVEGDVVVSAVEDLQVTVAPVGGDGRRRGRFRLDLQNTGTAPLTVAVAAKDDAGLLRFAVAPAQVEVPPRGSAVAYLGVKPKTPRWVGKSVDHSIAVTHELRGSADARRGQDQVTYTQGPRIPRWVLVLALLVVLALVGLLAWVVLRPGAEPGPALTTGTPPGVAMLSAEATAGDTVQLTWQHSPYATGYQLQQLRDGAVVGTMDVQAPTVSAAFAGLAAGEACFGVLPVSGDARGPTSEPTCVTVTGVADGASPTDGAPTDGAPTGAPTDGAEPTGPAVPPAGGPGQPTAPGSGAAGFEPQGWYVTYYRSALDDRALEDRGRQVQAAIQAQGVPARLVDSTTSTALADGATGFWYVVADGFADAAAASAECAARASTPDVTCTFDAPP